MNNLIVRLSIFLIASWMTINPAAHAWGPKAHYKITFTALKVVREVYEDTLFYRRPACDEGVKVSDLDALKLLGLTGWVDSSQMLEATVREMDLLKKVSAAKVTDYVAFRFGSLSRVVAEFNMPFSFPLDKETEETRSKLEQWVEDNLNTIEYDYASRQFLHYPTSNFQAERKEVRDAEKFIRLDFAGNPNYKDYLSRAVPIFFNNAVNAVADVWFTILKEQNPLREPIVTDRALAEYYAQEVSYFIRHGRHDDPDAVAAYATFKVTPQKDARFYELIGDAYMSAYREERDEAKRIKEKADPLDAGKADKLIDHAIQILGERGAEEYRHGLALRRPWPELEAKFTDYYLGIGQEFLDKKELEKSREQFAKILTALPTETQALQWKTKLELLIQARDERKERAKEFIDKAKELVGDAYEAEQGNQPEKALNGYDNASVLYSMVPEEFTDLRNEALDGTSEVDSKRDSILRDAITKSEEDLENARSKEDLQQYDDAIALYDQAVKRLAIVSEKYDLYARAQEVVTDAQNKKQAAVQAKAAIAAQGGPAPAPPPAPAP